MEESYSAGEIDRVVYIWARYAGKRDSTKDGKHYSKTDLKELIRKLNLFCEDKKNFNDGFEKEDAKGER